MVLGKLSLYIRGDHEIAKSEKKQRQARWILAFTFRNLNLPDGVYIEVWTSGPTIYIKRHPCLGTSNINWFSTYWATFCWLQGTTWANPLHKGHPWFGDIQKSVTPIHIGLNILICVTFGENIEGLLSDLTKINILVKNHNFRHVWWKHSGFAVGFSQTRHLGKKS